MNEPQHADAPLAEAPQAPPPDVAAQIASLRVAGADRFDPVRLHYIEALARRATAYQGSARQQLDVRLTQALSALQQRFVQAQADAQDIVARCEQQYPHAADEARRLFAAGDFRELRRSAARLDAGDQHAALSALVRQLDQHTPEHADTGTAAPTRSRPELKTVRHFRNTWSKLSVDLQVAQALDQAPKNAGPINSHMLVLRSLEMMRDISPDYLNRFMTYADTLLSLDQGEKEKLPVNRKAQSVKKGRK